MKIIVAAALLSISLCSCSAFNDGYLSQPGQPYCVGDGNSALVSHARNQADGQQLAEQHCKRFGKSARSIGWKAYEHFSYHQYPIPQHEAAGQDNSRRLGFAIRWQLQTAANRVRLNKSTALGACHGYR